MLSESARRAAALAVTRYGVDKVRVKEAARSAQRAQAEGQQTDLVTLLVDEKLLSPVQADEIRLALDKTHLDLDRQIAASPAKQTRIVSVGKGPEADPVDAPDLRRVGDACAQLLRQAGVRRGRTRTDQAIVAPQLRRRGVTAREAEVLRLLEDRLTNREIAARLFLSPRTVEKHVASLLAKLGAPTRADLGRQRNGNG